jgi:putative hydrolase of the HAD superfamily
VTLTRDRRFVDGPPEAVTFDYWDTLVCTRSAGTRDARRVALSSLFTTRGLDVDVSVIDQALDEAVRTHNEHWLANRQFLVDDGVDVVVAALGVTFDSALRTEVADTLVHAAQELRPSLTPGVADLLACLTQAGVKVGIICDVGLTASPVLRTYLDHHGVLELFDHWSFSDEVGVYKPDAAIFHHALEGLGGVSPSRAVHVGDLRRTDVAGARGVGMVTVRYAGRHDDDPSGGAEADLVVYDHGELATLLGVPTQTDHAGPSML